MTAINFESCYNQLVLSLAILLTAPKIIKPEQLPYGKP